MSKRSGLPWGGGAPEVAFHALLLWHLLAQVVVVWLAGSRVGVVPRKGSKQGEPHPVRVATFGRWGRVAGECISGGPAQVARPPWLGGALGVRRVTQV